MIAFKGTLFSARWLTRVWRKMWLVRFFKPFFLPVKEKNTKRLIQEQLKRHDTIYEKVYNVSKLQFGYRVRGNAKNQPWWAGF